MPEKQYGLDWTHDYAEKFKELVADLDWHSMKEEGREFEKVLKDMADLVADYFLDEIRLSGGKVDTKVPVFVSSFLNVVEKDSRKKEILVGRICAMAARILAKKYIEHEKSTAQRDEFAKTALEVKDQLQGGK